MSADGADERLVVMLEARISEFEKRMRQAEQSGSGSYRRLRQGSSSATAQMEADMIRASGRINQALAATSTRIGSFAKSFAMGFAGGVITTAFASLTTNINETVQGIARIGDEAKRAGLGVGAFQEWKFVAEQNRIGIDAMTDGFKELSLRADEFIVTGKGAGAEAFQRLGFGAQELKTKLQDPSALMLEIIGRLQSLDKAAQIRIADELFGGTGGERFVELLDQGEAGIRSTIDRAHEAGAVMDEQMVRKAQELDRRWKEITTTTGNWFKGFAVGAADAVGRLAGVRQSLDEMLGDEGRARAILGNEVYEAMAAAKDLTDEQVRIVQELDGQTSLLLNQARTIAIEFESISEELKQTNPQLSKDLGEGGATWRFSSSSLKTG